MFLAISRLKVESGKEKDFEITWKNREQSTDGIKGFKKFNLFKGIVNKEFTLYIFHSEWNSENDFINWTKSDSFKLAHKDANTHKDIYLEPPNYEGFEVII